MTPTALPTRVCFMLHVRAEMWNEYLRLHHPVHPDMLAEIAASGHGNYPLFAGPDGLLIGYDETDDDAAAATALTEIFHLEDQIANHPAPTHEGSEDA